ncbi:hypothetical protein [Rhodococcus koreensis]
MAQQANRRAQQSGLVTTYLPLTTITDRRPPLPMSWRGCMRNAERSRPPSAMDLPAAAVAVVVVQEDRPHVQGLFEVTVALLDDPLVLVDFEHVF